MTPDAILSALLPLPAIRLPVPKVAALTSMLPGLPALQFLNMRLDAQMAIQPL